MPFVAERRIIDPTVAFYMLLERHVVTTVLLRAGLSVAPEQRQ